MKHYLLSPVRSVAIVSFVAWLLCSATVKAKPPNVVLILTDNHGAWTLGCYGNPDIRTPNIDRLASEGTLFTRAFASNPVCSPTRATLLTGLVPSQHGVHSFLSGGRLQTGPGARCTLDEFTSLPEVLRDAGYACGLVGKWHLGANLHPQEGLDDYWITMPHGGTSTFYDAQIIENGEIRKEPKYLTDLWTEHAVRFIDQQAKQEKPFFLFLAYNGPYALSRLLLRDGRNRHAQYYADKEIASFPRVQPHPWQLNNRDFINNPTSIRRVATEVSGVDDGVGEVMNSLQAHGLDEDTVVIFVADQGWVGGHGGFFGMGDHTRPLTARDGMMQIPLIWRHPKKIAAGVRSDRMIANYDVMPTLLGHLTMADKMPSKPKSPGTDYSNLLKPIAKASNDFASANKVADKTSNDSREAVFYEFENLRCIRTTSHKYVHRHPNGPHELYDLENDPEEFVNLAGDPDHKSTRKELKKRLDEFYAEYSLPKYDMWNGGTSQVRIHDGIDEEMAQLASVMPPELTDGFKPAPLDVPDGFSVELAAGPPLVTHPTMACFDDQGRLYVCNNAGVNLSNDELEKQLPNAIRRLVDLDGDGRFDSSSVFADKMTFPMGGAWHDGSLFVASPPNIWKLTDTDDDGVADQREIIVTQFGYNGNAASIHGCFFGPDGRLYWTDGYHGHEFKDSDGTVTSQREGSYIFSCRPDGSDTQIHCGGGMDNPVEVDFTDSGDMLGTVNILYTRPRVDCLVHWLHGGAYPHRERVLDEIQVTGELLGPIHNFGHVAISGMHRYRSGVMDHRWGDDLFATFFNSGKVVRLEMQKSGSTYSVTQHEFLSSPSREFHPTDVLEDADGSLLVVDTGGWFYRGCPTSQFSKPELLGAIYRIRRDGMTAMVDPRGRRIDWQQQSPAALVKLFNDTRFAVRQRAIDESVKRGSELIPTLKSLVVRADVRVRQNAVWTLARMAQKKSLAAGATEALAGALHDAVADIRQAALAGMARSVAAAESSQVLTLLKDADAGVRRQAAVTLGRQGDADAVPHLFRAMEREDIDRSEEHAIIYAMIEIGDVAAIRESMKQHSGPQRSPAQPSPTKHSRGDATTRAALIAIDQIADSAVRFEELETGLDATDEATRSVAIQIAKRRENLAPQVSQKLSRSLQSDQWLESPETDQDLLASFIHQPGVARTVGEILQSDRPQSTKSALMHTIASAPAGPVHPSWIAPIRARLSSKDHEVVGETIAAVHAHSGSELNESLKQIADDASRPLALRVNALASIARHTSPLDDSLLDRLIGIHQNSGSPTASTRSAQIIGAAKLKPSQLLRIAPLLSHASPTDLRELLRVFQRQTKREVADAFLDAIESADSLMRLSETEFSEVVKRFPRETLDRANAILDRLKQHQQQKISRLEKLRKKLASGNADRGREIFMSEKAKCSSCHRVGPLGKRVGPDLTTIGANRTANDLLESLVFPSASIVRDYESYKVLTVDGRAVAGLLINESSTAIDIQQASGEKVSIRQIEIEQIVPSTVSIMPAGLDEALTETQLLDVVKFLQSQK